MYGGAFLFIEDSDYALYTFKYVFSFYVLVAAVLAYFHSDSKDALWSALKKDYSTVEARPDRMPMSGGLFGSSELDDMCAAKSFADDEGITVCRVKKKGKIGQCIHIPWDRIEIVEIVEPDKNFIDSVVAEGSRKAAAALLSAKIKLRRKRKAMTLVVPWHEQFARHAPPSVEIVKNWDWPFAVM
jgi:hypothetical protein